MVGTLAVLKQAHESNLLADLRQVLDEMRASGTWISDELYRRVLRDE